MALRNTSPKAKKFALSAAVAAAFACTAFAVPLAGVASAAPAVTIPSGNPADGQTFTVTGTGWPTPAQNPTGLQIIECSDPGGSTSNLPTDATGCDGTTVNPNQINTTNSGTFTAQYTAVLLNAGNSSISCDQTHFCVLWVGVDFNNQFLSGPHAFSTPFEIGSPPAMTPEAALAIALPVAAAAIAGGAFWYTRRGRLHATAAS